MFDINEIKLRATSKSYQLGKMLYHAGKVSQLSLTDNKVTAIVAGQHDYHVSLVTSEGLTGEAVQGETIQASCNCPAADYQDICKHMVAVALLVENSSESGLFLKSDLLNETAQQMGKKTQLKDWFKQKSKDELTDILMSYIEDSEHECDKWSCTMFNEKNGLDAAQLNKLITKALPKQPVWEWNEVHGYFSDAQEIFDILFPAIDKCAIDKQWQLILKALQRLNTVLEQIDDSGGFRFTIEGQLNQKLTTLFNQLSWSDDKKALWIFEHFQEYKYDIFPSVPEDFELSDGVKQIFLAACKAEIEKLQQSGVDLSNREQKWAIKRLTQPLLDQAKRVGDWKEQCCLMKKSACHHSDFLEISALYLHNDDVLDAEYYLQQAYQQASTSYETAQCQDHEVNVRVALNEFKQAWQLSWQMFHDNPSFRAFKKLTQLQQQIGVVDPDFIKKAEQILASCYQQSSRGLSVNADALLEFYIDQNELPKARIWVLSHKANSTNLLKLANLIMAAHPQESVDLHCRVLDSIIDQTKNSAYQEATDLLLKLEKGFKNSDAKRAILYRMIAKIIKKQKAKRNLMKLLKTHFAQCFD